MLYCYYKEILKKLHRLASGHMCSMFAPNAETPLYTVRRAHGNLITICISNLVAHFPHGSYITKDGLLIANFTRVYSTRTLFVCSVSAGLGVAMNPGLAGVAGVPGVGLISMVAGQPPCAGGSDNPPYLPSQCSSEIFQVQVGPLPGRGKLDHSPTFYRLIRWVSNLSRKVRQLSLLTQVDQVGPLTSPSRSSNSPS
jgi:hypothetical protein